MKSFRHAWATKIGGGVRPYLFSLFGFLEREFEAPVFIDDVSVLVEEMSLGVAAQAGGIRDDRITPERS